MHEEEANNNTNVQWAACTHKVALCFLCSSLFVWKKRLGSLEYFALFLFVSPRIFVHLPHSSLICALPHVKLKLKIDGNVFDLKTMLPVENRFPWIICMLNLFWILFLHFTFILLRKMSNKQTKNNLKAKYASKTRCTPALIVFCQSFKMILLS